MVRKFCAGISGIVLLVILNLLSSMTGCSETAAPEPPDSIEIISGNEQYYLHGSPLPEPLVVMVSTKSGAPAVDAGVAWTIVQGGGSLAPTLSRTGSSGLASTQLTLGSGEGVVEVKASIESDPSKFVLFSATSSYVPCQEAETTLTVTYGQSGKILLATFKSALYSSNETNGGIVIVDPFNKTVSSFKVFPTQDLGFITVPWDIALSPRGELFFSSSAIQDKIEIVDPSGETRDFVLMDDPDGAELATNGNGLVGGCDVLGPFLLSCDRTLFRPSAAYYPSREINNDAVAIDPATDDIYYVSVAQNALLRLPLDSLTVEGPPEVASSLTAEEASGARGMVCDETGNVYILVDTPDTKELLEVDALGTKTILYDFFDRGQGDAAGVQRDLALDRNLRYLYTLDTLNDELLVYQLDSPDLGVQVVFKSEDLSIFSTISSGERVGLVVLP